MPYHVELFGLLKNHVLPQLNKRRGKGVARFNAQNNKQKITETQMSLRLKEQTCI
jgi:hypothetical protein